jgi:hypothetical protein
MKNKIAVLLKEASVSHNKQKLHKVGDFRELLATNQDLDDALRSLLRLCRETVVRLGKTESALVGSLRRDCLLVRTRGTAYDHSRGRPDPGADLGAGSWRRGTLFPDQKGHQLLPSMRGREEFGEHQQAHHSRSNATSIRRRW